MVEDKYICEYPNHDFSAAFKSFANKFKPIYEGIRLPAQVNYEYLVNEPVRYSESKYRFFSTYQPGGSRCTKRLVSSYNAPYLAAMECARIVGPEEICFESNDLLCEVKLAKEVELDHEHKLCIAPKKRTVRVNMFKNSYGGFCNQESFDLKLTTYAKYFESVREHELPDDWVPTYIGREKKKFCFTTIDNTYAERFLSDFQDAYYATLVDRKLSVAKHEVDRTYLYRDSRIASGHYAWFLDILIKPPPSGYPIQIDGNYYTLSSEIFSNSIAQYTFQEGDAGYPKVKICIDPENVVVSPFFNMSCHAADKAAHCFYRNLVDEFIINVSSNNSDILHKSTDYFFDLFGRNDTPPYFTYQHHLYGQTKVGNWISSIFGDLIAPFMEAILNQLIPFIIEPIIVAFVDFVKLWTKYIEQLLIELNAVLTALINSLCDLVLLSLNILVGLIAVVDSKILLSEYAFLFIVLVGAYRFNYTAIAVLLVAMMLIFGIERRSPSFLLFFLNEQYHYLNLTHYSVDDFDWDYTVSYFDGSKKMTLHLFTSTLNVE